MSMKTQLLLTCVVVWVYGHDAVGVTEHTSTEQASQACPDGFQFFESSCYRLVSDSPTDGSTARTKCQEAASGSHLVFIQSQSEQTFVQTLAEAEAAGVDKDYWIGLTFTSDVDHPHWLDGSPLGDFTAWGIDGVFNEASSCVRLQQISQYKWNDKPCANEFGFLCEIESSAVGEGTLTTPVNNIVPTADACAKHAHYKAGPSNMAAPMDNHLIETMNVSTMFRCAACCLQHGGCLSFNYQSGKLLSICELYSKKFKDDELQTKHGYIYYRW